MNVTTKESDDLLSLELTVDNDNARPAIRVAGPVHAARFFYLLLFTSTKSTCNATTVTALPERVILKMAGAWLDYYCRGCCPETKAAKWVFNCDMLIQI